MLQSFYPLLHFCLKSHLRHFIMIKSIIFFSLLFVATLACEDKRSESDCKYWAELGNCEATSVYAPWMHENCQKTCGSCGNSESKVLNIDGSIFLS